MMNLFRLFKRKPNIPPLSVSVREALKVVIHGMNPEVSPEEFESLYQDILDSEVHGRRNATAIINNFAQHRKKHDRRT